MHSDANIPKQRKILRVGVIGSGAFVEQCHLPGLQSHPRARVVAVCGRRFEHVRSLASRFNIPAIHCDYRELLARSDIDAVTIATVNSEHATQAIAAFAEGKHVFCEKPISTDVMSARKMLHAAERSGKIHQVAFTYRYLFGVQELRRRIRRGEIGVPHQLRTHFNSWEGLLLDSPSIVGFRGKAALAGGGVLYDVGSHLFDLARFILGPIEVVTGFSQRIPRLKSRGRKGETSVETDDFSTALFRHANGVYGQWFVSRVAPSYGDKAHVEVVGDNGALRASLSRGSVDVLRMSSSLKPEWKELSLPEEASNQMPSCLGLMMRSFVDACLKGKLNGDVDASFHDGFAAQQALAAVTKSSARLPWVRLENK